MELSKRSKEIIKEEEELIRQIYLGLYRKNFWSKCDDSIKAIDVAIAIYLKQRDKITFEDEKIGNQL